MSETLTRPPRRRISAIIPVALFAQLATHAIRRHTTLSTVLIWALEEFLARERKAAS